MSRLREKEANKRSLTTLVGPVNQVVTVLELKNSLRIDPSVTDDDALLLSLIKTATTLIENVVGVRLIEQTLLLSMDSVPFRKYYDPLAAVGGVINPTQPLSEVIVATDKINMLVNPVSSVTSFTYYDEDNVPTVWDSSNYFVDSNEKPSRLIKNSEAVWPQVVLREGSGIEIEFIAGFGPDAADVPEELKTAVLLQAQSLYQNRDCSDAKGMPYTVKAMLMPWNRIKI